jgi:hypothetical protein
MSFDIHQTTRRYDLEDGTLDIHRCENLKSYVRHLFIIIYLNCKWFSTQWQWYYNKAQHTNNTHHTNITPHSNKTQHTQLHKQ